MAASIVERAGHEAPVPFRRVVAAHHSTVGGLHTEAARAGAELLVVGSSHRGGFGRVTLGSHSERVLHAAPCAVTVVPRGLADSSWALRRITVAYDDSEDARHAVEVARRVTAASRATLAVTGVIDPAPGPLEHYIYRADWRDDERRRRDAAEQALTQVCAAGETAELRAGPVIEQLLLASRDTDLLVLGSRGHGPARRVIVGSTGHSVVRSAACPVIIVPRGGADVI
jgi:nucleotide-binding universal stress UspA family protein